MYETIAITISCLVSWILSYTMVVYTRQNDIKNISNYFTYIWLIADWINLNSCIVTFKGDFSNILIIESIIFVIFDIVSIVQLLYLTEKRKKVSIEVVSSLLLCGVLMIVLEKEQSVLQIYVWLGQLLLLVSRIPSIINYYKKSNILRYREVVMTVMFTILANTLGLSLIVIKILDNKDIEYMPWVIMKCCILLLDMIIVRIVLYKKRDVNEKIREIS